MTDETFPCPCCGFLVFGGPPGTYEICHLCDWEDDHVQLRFPTMRGGANGQSLVEAQRVALSRIPVETRTYKGIPRDPSWRPLVEGDVEAGVAPATGTEYFEAAGSDAPLYYWRSSSSDGA